MNKSLKGIVWFLARCKLVHQDRYDYSEVIYTGCFNKVVIKCREHGPFSQQPNAHIGKQQQGCPVCGRTKLNVSITEKSRKSALNFSDKATAVHSGRFSYSKVVYTRSWDKVEITCATHGSFWQTPNAHLAGKGCRKCNLSGFNTGNPATLYLLSSGDYFKVGITNRPATARARDVRVGSKLDFRVVSEWSFQTGDAALQLEKLLLTQFSTTYLGIPDKFCGSTECFECEDINQIKSLIDIQVKQFTEDYAAVAQG